MVHEGSSEHSDWVSEKETETSVWEIASDPLVPSQDFGLSFIQEWSACPLFTLGNINRSHPDSGHRHTQTHACIFSSLSLKSHRTHWSRLTLRIDVVVAPELGLPIRAPDTESEVTDEAGEEGQGGGKTRKQTGGVIRRGMQCWKEGVREAEVWMK